MCKQTAGLMLAFWKHCFNILENAFHIQGVLPCILAKWRLTIYECYPTLPWLLAPGTQGKESCLYSEEPLLRFLG